MSSTASEACCTIPPVEGDEYAPKGTYKALYGFDRVYVVGSEDADKAIVVVYDVFGYWPQTIQGADIIASTLQAQVFMPDFFRGKPYPLSKFPPTNEEDKKEMYSYGRPDLFQASLAELIAFGKALRVPKSEGGPGKTFLGNLGLCWGGKVTVLSGANEDKVFDAVSEVHPALLSTDDAEKLLVPLGLYPTNDEPLDIAQKMADIVSTKPFASKSQYKPCTVPGTFHGFAGARADLKDEENKKQFAEFYATVSTFFAKAAA